MGQSTSFENNILLNPNTNSSTSSSSSNGNNSMSNELDFLHDQIRRHSITIRQLANITYQDLHEKIQQLNQLSSKYVDCHGKQLMFEPSPGSYNSILWKATVRIKCIKLNPVEQKVEKTRELNLKQFLQLYNTMQNHLAANNSIIQQPPLDVDQEHDQGQVDDSGQGSSRGSSNPGRVGSRMTTLPQMDASILLDKLEKSTTHTTTAADKILEESTECCICMEYKPEVTLPCTHSYCLACIEQWNMDHKTCPICREKLETTDETWVLEEAPTNTEISHEIQKNLFDLTR